MGRKIPAPKRHFGVRDPLKQLAEKFEKIKDKIDNPPKQKDFQEVSKSFKKFLELKQQCQDSEQAASKSKKEKNKSERRNTDGTVFKHLPNETDAQLMRRVNRITNNSIREAQYAAKYNVNIVRNNKTGDIELKKRPKDEISELLKAKQIEAKGTRIPYGQRRKIKPKDPNAPKITRLDKLKLKKEIKKELREEKSSFKGIELKQDEFKFGEVVHEPPTLNVKPRHAAADDSIPKPGKRNLLLKQLIDNKSESAIDEEDAVDEHVKKIKKLKPNSKLKLDLKGKRKKLPSATRMILDKERLNTIELYRQSKKLKLASRNVMKKE